MKELPYCPACDRVFEDRSARFCARCGGALAQLANARQIDARMAHAEDERGRQQALPPRSQPHGGPRGRRRG